MKMRHARIEIKATGEKVNAWVDEYNNDKALRNTWVIENGERKGERLQYDDAWIMLKNDVPKWSLARIKVDMQIAGKDAEGNYIWKHKEALVGITGGSLQFDYSIHYVDGGESVITKDKLIEVVDKDFYIDSPIATVAKFYSNWKEEKRYICKCCKEAFIWSMDRSITCKDCKEGTKRHEGSKKFDGFTENIHLTDEMVKDYNRRVAMKDFKGYFERNSKVRDDGMVLDGVPESLMDYGSRINYYKSVLTNEDLWELRNVFKECYNKATKALWAWEQKCNKKA